VTALVRLRAGSAASEAELRSAAGGHVADFKVPRRVLFVDEIVRSPSGKPDYRWARETALARLA
jgi:fatty-acyl-CoA synthase